MVDGCLALSLADEEEDAVDDTMAKLKWSTHSLNRSLSFIFRCPLFLDIEIKKTI